MKNNLFIRLLLIVLVGTSISACQKVPITGRKQMHLLPNSMIRELGASSYTTFLKENPPLPATSAQVAEIQNIGVNISDAVTRFMSDNGLTKRIEGYNWEYNVVDSKDVNAFCMPGGKVVVYTGILPLTKDNAGLAVVMGHEIAHAIADHGNERMSQQLAVQLGGISLAVAMQQKPQQTQDIFNTAYGIGTTLGTLAYSRQHELEADKLGLIFMAMAGYSPERALSFWEDMAKISGSAKVPEFLSTHPSDEHRISKIREFLPEAMKYYNPDAAVKQNTNINTQTQTKPSNPSNKIGIKVK